jgi:hypothetical protein
MSKAELRIRTQFRAFRIFLERFQLNSLPRRNPLKESVEAP